jgi:hypothetical protein
MNLNLKPVTPINNQTLSISLYEKGYMRANKALTTLLELQPGDSVNFYNDETGHYYFGKCPDGAGYRVRRQRNVDAMFFNAQAMCITLRKFFKVDEKVIHLKLSDQPRIRIDERLYLLIQEPH